jgi:heterodisulfide reductase subunit C
MEPNANQSYVTVTELDSRFKDLVAAQLGHLDLVNCFQCGVCSGSCPTADRMEFGPRRLLQMMRLGLTEKVLSSPDVWFCVSCYSCTARCPQGIEVADVMSALRNISIAYGLAKDKEATFSQVFLGILLRYGRMFEPEVLLRFYAAEANLTGILKQAGLGLTMFRKGKIGLRPDRIENPTELKEIATKIMGNGGEQR